MNSFSTFGGMLARGQTNVNSMTYINRYAQGITADFSGSSYIDLSNTYQYAVTSSGLNMTNGINGNTFARLKYNGAYLKTADFSSTGSFTIYLKHAARFNPLPPLNFQYPNVISLSQQVVYGGSSFTSNYYFYSLNPVASVIPYSITGCNPADLNGAALTGNFTTISQSTTYSVASGVVGKTITFNVSGGTAVSIYVPSSTYTVTYNFLSSTWGIKDSNGLDVSQPLDLSASNVYLFDQSDPSNAGTQGLLFSSSQTSYIIKTDATSVWSGIPGTPGAYTIITTTTRFSSAYIYPLTYCVSIQTNRYGNLVLAVSDSTVGQNGPFYTQQELSFGAGSFVTFIVSHQTMTGFTLVFGTTRDGTVSDETYVSRNGDKVVLSIPKTYTGPNLYFYTGSTTVKSYITPRITYKTKSPGIVGSGFLNGTDISNSNNTTSPQWVNVGIGMVGITPDGNRISFGLQNSPNTGYGVVYDYSFNAQTWNKTITNNTYTAGATLITNGALYQFHPYVENTAFQYSNYDYYLNSTGKICAVTGLGTSGTWNGSFMVYDYKDVSNAWYRRGGNFTGSSGSYMAHSFDADYSFNTLVVGTRNNGNFFRIYNYNSGTNAYTLVGSNISGTNNFGFSVRINDEGTKIMAVAPGYYTSIYSKSGSTWALDYSFNVLSSGIRTPGFDMSNNINHQFISKSLETYISLNALTKTLYIYTHNLSAKSITLRNTIPEYMLFTRAEISSKNDYWYTVSLSGNGNRIVIMAGWMGNGLSTDTGLTGKSRGVFFDYNKIANIWTKVGDVIDSSGNAYLTTGIARDNPYRSSWFGRTITMSYDGSTIVIGDAHLNNRSSNSLYGTGAYHIFNCHAQEQFPPYGI